MPQIRESFYLLYQTALLPGFKVIARLWWLWLFIFSVVLVKNMIRYWRTLVYRKDMRWVLLEILIPREVRKSPKAMEQIFSQIYSLRNSAENWSEKYVEGEVTAWWSFEIASFGGEIHLFIRTLAKYKNIIESNIYSVYNDAEVVESADYVDRLPAKTTDIYKMGMDLFGLELALGREDAYPIKTYPEFENMEEERSLDPLSNLIEVLSKIKKEEQLWLQLVVRPVDPAGDYQKKGRKLVKEMKEKTVGKAKVIGSDKDTVMISRTPGEIEVIETVEKNLAKAAFETVIRYIYLSPRSIFNRNLPYRGVRGAFAQYSTQNMNYFIPNIPTRTMVWWGKPPFLFPKKREEARKQRILQSYRNRALPEEMLIGKIFNSQIFYFDKKSRISVFNTESLATLFHLPSFLVLTAPFIKRVEAKRLGPPAGLQIFGGEEDVPGLKVSEGNKNGK
ncbi:MAG: hypothetical protein HYY55_04460 [Candidatus Niyogibacteria bacterium]|nr:MAG: hypothetical protein HYY55_04460 [Candidatus Niyogibacteria bacterium]